jgi:hypothetical protein
MNFSSSKKNSIKKEEEKRRIFSSRQKSFHNDGDLDFTSDALELHVIREAKQHNELYPIHIKGTENIADVFTKANAPNFSQVISFITGSKLSAFRTQEHHFELIKEGYVGTYFPQIFDFLKRQFSSF